MNDPVANVADSKILIIVLTFTAGNFYDGASHNRGECTDCKVKND